MRRALLLLPMLLTVACEQRSPSHGSPHPEKHVAARGEPVVDSEARGAAEALRRYYDRIEAGDYAAAYRMRTPGGADAQRFAANFQAYERYRAELGAPAGPVAQDGFDYVEVPVMTTGRFVGGKSFGTAGRVMVRRARTGPDRAWYVLAR